MMLSRALEQTLRRALTLAADRRHEYATLEHLLLGLCTDPDANRLLAGCGVNLDKLQADLTEFLDHELAGLATEKPGEPKPTAGFQRVVQRAAIQIQAVGRDDITGADVVVALTSEHESHAMYFLELQDVKSEAVRWARDELLPSHAPRPAAANIASPPVDIPKPGPGSTFVVTPAGFELKPRVPARRERADPSQQALHVRLRRRIERLQRMMAGIGNTHPALAAEFADYMMFVQVALSELDVASLWSAGNGLSEFVRALDLPRAAMSMTEPLEPEVSAELHALVRDHAAFILGFAGGRTLLARAQALKDADRPTDEIRVTILSVLRPMLATKDLLAETAKQLVQSLTRALAELKSNAFPLLAGGSETGKNGLIAFGRALHPILVVAGGADVISVLTGNPQADTLRSALIFLRDNGDAIIAFAASDPQLSEWLAWLTARAQSPSGVQ